MSQLVSIIIPSFNRAHLIKETVESVKAQTYPNFECIIVDDGSTDDTLTVAQKFAASDSRFRVYSRPTNLLKGANTCRNYGFEMSKGEYINWFDSDDIMHPEMIEEKIRIAQNTSAEMVVCRASFFSTSPEDLTPDVRISIAPQTDNPPFEFFAGGFWFGTPQAMIHRSLVMQHLPPFNSKLPRNQETEFFVRVLLKTPKIIYVEAPLVFIRKHTESIGGKYHQLSDTHKLSIDLPAYQSMYRAFRNSPYLTYEVKKYFADFFYRCLRKMPVEKVKYCRHFLFGIKYGHFPLFMSVRIFFGRLFRNAV